MANAMLEDDHFKSSHQDLVAFSNLDQFNNNLNSNMVPVDKNNNNNDSNGSINTNDSTSPSSTNMLRTKKSVEFFLQPSDPNNIKRCKPTARWTAKQVVDAISTSFTQQERLEAIQKTKEAFDHEIASLHDDEIAAGADAVLTKHLTFLICHSKHMTVQYNNMDNATTSITELVTTLESLEALYRASSNMVGLSYQRMGPELLYLLTLIVDEEVDRRVEKLVQQQQHVNSNSMDDGQQQQQQAQQLPLQHAQSPKQSSWVTLQKVLGDQQQQQQQGDDDMMMNDMDDSNNNNDSTFNRPTTLTATVARPPPAVVLQQVGTLEGDTILRKAMRLFGHFARVGDATKSIAHFPGLLQSLVNLVRLRPYECVPWEARLSALWTLANLACNNENMSMMVCTPGLVAALVEVSCRPLHPGDSVEMTMEVLRSRSIASRGILNLSWAPENKIILAEHTALIDLLSELAVHRAAPLHRSRTVRQILVTTRCHAAGALRNLAAAPRRTKIALCEYKNGHLLDILTDAALNDPDQAVKDRSLAAIHNLAIYDTAERIVNHPALVLALKDVLLSAEEDHAGALNRHEEGTTPKSHAQATILVLERSITPDMKAYENLRELLSVINPVPASVNNSDDQSSRNNTTSDDDDMEAIEATAV